MPVLKIYTKQVYGNTLIYPANKLAKAIADLTNCKTLSDKALRIAETELGFKIERVFEDQSEI